MPITFPDFKNPHYSWIRVCGEALKAAPDIARLAKGGKRKTAILATERGNAQVVLILGGTSENHVHFDIYSPELVSKRLNDSPKSKPDHLSELSEIDDIIGQLYGREIVLDMGAVYHAKITELPETGIIRSLFFDTKMGSVAVKLEGAMFSIQGAPIQKIQWSVRSGGDIAVTLGAQSVKTLISEDYLINAYHLAEQAFYIFVLGKVPNEPK